MTKYIFITGGVVSSLGKSGQIFKILFKSRKNYSISGQALRQEIIKDFLYHLIILYKCNYSH
jgi:hypothetical protein